MLKIVFVMSLLTKIIDQNGEQPVELHQEEFALVDPKIDARVDSPEFQDLFEKYEAIRLEIIQKMADIIKKSE